MSRKGSAGPAQLQGHTSMRTLVERASGDLQSSGRPSELGPARLKALCRHDDRSAPPLLWVYGDTIWVPSYTSRSLEHSNQPLSILCIKCGCRWTVLPKDVRTAVSKPSERVRVVTMAAIAAEVYRPPT
jgi:hypothetical protein